MTIRWRLTLWLALLLGIILIAAGIVLHTLLQRNLLNQVEDNLRVHAAEVHGTLNPQRVPAPLDYEVVHSRLPAVNEFASPGIYIQLVDSAGSVVVKSDSLGEQELPVDPSLIARGFGGSVAFGTVAAGNDARVRIMVSPLYLQDEVLVLEVAQSLNPIDATMSQLRWAILASVVFALVLATVSGSLIVRGALSPVSQITRAARGIATGADLGRRVGYTGPADEVGELANTLDDMIERLDQVFRSQRHFVADASHELRGPLTVIRGNLDLLKRDISAEDRRESLAAIGREGARMAKIVEDLLLLAETETGEPPREEKVSLKEVLNGERERAQALAGHRKIAIGRLEDLAASGDARQLRQLLANLVDNAIKYTPEPGTVTLSLYRDGEWARLEVADTGVGIPPEHQPHIFDRFYRVDAARSPAGGSTGLGLAIVKGIAEQHGGRVTVSSRPGKGSTFTAWLKISATS